MARSSRQLNLIDLFNEIMEEYASKLDATLTKALEDKGIKATGQTINSLKIHVDKNVATALNSLKVEFRTSGRIQEMKNMRSGGRQVPIDTISKWVKTVGLNKFAYVPGYDITQNPEQVKNAEARIGYAIAKSKQKLGKRKARSWYNKNVYQAIYGADGLINRILDDLPEEALNAIKELTNGN